MTSDPAQERTAAALAALRAGRFVAVSDARDRENETDLVLAAQHATPDRMAFLIRHSSGIVCAPMPGALAERLGLAPMVTHNTDPHRTAFTVSVDAIRGTTTGISAADRATTLRALASPDATPHHFARPGHIFPLRAHPRGLSARAGHTEASVALMKMAGLVPVAVICELVDDDGAMLGGERLRSFTAEHDIPQLDIADIAAAMAGDDNEDAADTHDAADIHLLASAPLPTRYGEFTVRLLRSDPDGLEHLVLTRGDIHARGPVLVRIHSECATGDLFGSRRCDCGDQLDASMRAISEAGRGVLVYERGHEGRGIGLADKLRAYTLQDAGADTVDANLWLGHPADARNFLPAARLLAHLGVRDVVLLTNNPDKLQAIRATGLTAEMRPLWSAPQPDNVRYLETKRTRFGHELPQARGAALR